MRIVTTIKKIVRPLPPQYIKWWFKYAYTPPKKKKVILYPVDKFDKFWPPRS